MSGVVTGPLIPGAEALPLSHRFATRIASFGILAVLLALGACAIWGAALTYEADSAVKRATEASNAMEQVRRGLAAERLVRRGAGISPGDEAKARHKEASASVARALEAAHTFTEGTDRRLTDELMVRHATYLKAAGPAWGEIADDSLPSRIFDPYAADPSRVAASLATLKADADQLSEHLRLQAMSLLALLVAIQTRVFIGGPALFALGLLLVGALWRMQRSEQRRGTSQLVQNAYAASRDERRLRGVVQSAPDPTLICAGPGNVIYCNSAAQEQWSQGSEPLEGRSILMLAHPDDRPALRAWWEQLRPAAEGARAGDATRRMVLRLRAGNAGWRRVTLTGTNLLEDRTVQGMVLTIHEADDQQEPAPSATEMSLLDPLTRLPNPALLRDRLTQGLARAGRRTDKVGVLLISLDGLADPAADRPLNDALTLEAATRIQACVRPQDTVGRLDAALFTVVREPVGDEADGVAVAQAIAAQFSRGLGMQDAAAGMMVSPRIGVVVGDPMQDSADGLLRNAALAMQQVAQGAVQRHAVFRSDVRSDALDRLELEGDLRHAVQRLQGDQGAAEAADTQEQSLAAGLDWEEPAPPEFRVHYQPIVSLRTGRTCGFEALLRWHHPLHGPVPSQTLIPMAERTGMIVPLGQWVLEEACRKLVAWQRQFRVEPPLSLSVNLSAAQFRLPDLVGEVTRALQATGLPAACLRLELTEATIMRDAEHAVRTLWSLKALGVQLAIDDFGTGYSALPYLKQLPIGLLKIDGSFVSGIGQDQEDTAIVRAVMSLAKSLGWGVTAEGIETVEQAELLEAWGCEFGQGYHFGHPLDGLEAESALQSSLTPRVAQRDREWTVPV